ncbi:MAG TPA: helix-turn-helix transcriptional regulator [Puia sp.]|nr:helix-turn-helix transcriptional regulator [Puia sp.]
MNKEQQDLLKKIGARIVEIRKEQNLTQVELGHLFDADKQTIQRLEAGRTNATILTLHKIAKAFDISLKELLDVE